MGAWKQSLRKARSLKPSRIRQEADRPFRMELRGVDAAERESLRRVLIPDEVQGRERSRASQHLVGAGEEAEIHVCGPGMAGGDGLVVDPEAPDAGLRGLVRAYPEYRLALGRTFVPIRTLLAQELVQATALRNAAIAALSALPEVVPNPLSLVLAVGEMAPETVWITANQMRLAFQLAALWGEPAGWRAQSGRIGLILAGAFGWRTLARELVGLIPAGYGLAAKTGIAYSGTLAVGAALLAQQRERPVPGSRKFQRTQAALPERQTA